MAKFTTRNQRWQKICTSLVNKHKIGMLVCKYHNQWDHNLGTFPRVHWQLLDEDDWEEEDEPPAALRVVVLEDAGDPPLAVHGAGRHAAVLRLLTHQQPLAIDPLAIQKTFWHRRRLHLHLKSRVKTSFCPLSLAHSGHLQHTAASTSLGRGEANCLFI